METKWFSADDWPIINQNLSRWAYQRIFGKPGEFEKCCTMGVFNNEELIAALVYYDHDPDAGVIQISGAAKTKRWLIRPVLHEMFRVPFDVMGCQMVVMRVSPDDNALHRMLTSYGFSSYTIPRLRGRFEDEIIFTLTDDIWRTNKFNKRLSKHGQEITARAA